MPCENTPGDKGKSDAEWLDFARRNGQTTYHVVGTCKMGQDPMAVVDERRPGRGYLTHTTHDLEYSATNAILPPGVELAYDGLTLEIEG